MSCGRASQRWDSSEHHLRILTPTRLASTALALPDAHTEPLVSRCISSSSNAFGRVNARSCCTMASLTLLDSKYFPKNSKLGERKKGEDIQCSPESILCVLPENSQHKSSSHCLEPRRIGACRKTLVRLSVCLHPHGILCQNTHLRMYLLFFFGDPAGVWLISHAVRSTAGCT